MKYDYLFVTHLPAFYKVNLYNQIAMQAKVYVIFIGSGSSIRTADFTNQNYVFDYCIINDCAFEQRNKFKSALKTIKAAKQINYRHLVVGGWDLIEYWLLILLSAKSKNCLALESSIYESNLQGYRALVKKWFLRRISLAFPSGQAHEALLKKLMYQGCAKKTLGVGIMNYQPREHTQKNFRGQFLYVGRFAPEKNLFVLLEAFRALPQYRLTLIGGGPLKAALVKSKSDNVTILDHVPNDQLVAAYKAHDVFILPSVKEPWGLVVEEALYYGLPVLISDKVGSGPDLIDKPSCVFPYNNVQALIEVIKGAEKDYAHLCARIANFDLQKKDHHQVQQYLEALA